MDTEVLLTGPRVAVLPAGHRPEPVRGAGDDAEGADVAVLLAAGEDGAPLAGDVVVGVAAVVGDGGFGGPLDESGAAGRGSGVPAWQV